MAKAKKFFQSMTAEEFRAQYASPIDEEEVQRTILEYCKAMGWIALQTSHRTKLTTCPNCQQRFRPQGGYGASPGVPDVLVLVPGECFWLGIECKGRNTKVSPEQQALADRGAITIVRSLDEFVKFMAERFGL